MMTPDEWAKLQGFLGYAFIEDGVLKIRRDAPIELPHILVVMDDRQGRVIEDLYSNCNNYEKLYDFDLNMKGGHLTGYRVDKKEVFDRLALYEKDIDGLYGVRTDFTLAVGDGNHSLATGSIEGREPFCGL